MPFFILWKQYKDTDAKIGDLDDFKMPFGLTKSGDEMSALEYLESETNIPKTFEEILDASKENFNRTLLSKTLEIHKKFSDLLHQPIKYVSVTRKLVTSIIISNLFFQNSWRTG